MEVSSVHNPGKLIHKKIRERETDRDQPNNKLPDSCKGRIKPSRWHAARHHPKRIEINQKCMLATDWLGLRWYILFVFFWFSLPVFPKNVSGGRVVVCNDILLRCTRRLGVFWRRDWRYLCKSRESGIVVSFGTERGGSRAASERDKHDSSVGIECASDGA